MRHPRAWLWDDRGHTVARHRKPRLQHHVTRVRQRGAQRHEQVAVRRSHSGRNRVAVRQVVCSAGRLTASACQPLGKFCRQIPGRRNFSCRLQLAITVMSAEMCFREFMQQNVRLDFPTRHHEQRRYSTISVTPAFPFCSAATRGRAQTRPGPSRSCSPARATDAVSEAVLQPHVDRSLVILALYREVMRRRAVEESEHGVVEVQRLKLELYPAADVVQH